MKKTNESKTWNIDHRFGEITFDFAKEVDIHKAFEAMKAAASENAPWLDSLSDNENGTIKIGYGFDSGVFPDAIPAICKAVAEIFTDNTFAGSAIFDDTRCLWIDQFDFTFDGKDLFITETFEDDECGYFCPECGCWIRPAHASFGDDEEIECDDCEETFKASELKYVPSVVTETTYSIG